MPVKWIVFDVGETLFSERRLFNEWADWLNIPRNELAAVLDEHLSAGRDHRGIFETIRPGFDLAEERRLRLAAGRPDELALDDLYEDALPTIIGLAKHGFRVGIVGNQPESTATLLRTLDAPISLIGTSEQWNVKKPDAAFFERILSLTNTVANEVAYVGDRMDNDVLPAQAIGMVGVFVRRGPWARAQELSGATAVADHVIDNLSELLEVLSS